MTIDGFYQRGRDLNRLRASPQMNEAIAGRDDASGQTGSNPSFGVHRDRLARPEGDA